MAQTKYGNRFRRKAQRLEQDNDALGLLCVCREACDEIDRLIGIITRVRDAWLDWGPVDDGTPAGTSFDEALTAAVRVANSNSKRDGKKRG